MHKKILFSSEYHGELSHPRELSGEAVLSLQNYFGTWQPKDFKVSSLIIKLIVLQIVELYLNWWSRDFSILYRLLSVCQAFQNKCTCNLKGISSLQCIKTQNVFSIHQCLYTNLFFIFNVHLSKDTKVQC